MSLDSLQALFLNELKDVYHAEKQLLRALPRMAKAAESPDLQEAFTSHLKETEGHVKRLERIFKDLGEAARGKRCKGMEGLVEEGKEVLEEDGEGPDASHVSPRARPAAYGCLRTYAQLLGLDNAVELLAQTLAEEEAADEKLTSIGERGVNAEAAAVGGEREE